MACTSCTDTTPCGTPDCGCKFEVDAGCVRYSGESLGAAGIVEGDTLATILETLNTKFETYGPGDYVDVVDEAAGSNCAFGGLKFILYSGLDNTVKETKYICGIGAASFLNGTGTANRIPKFLDTDTLGDSIMSESGSVITIDGTIKLTGGTPGLGKVLTSDADGDASWATPSSGGDLMKDGSVALTANWNAGAYTITSNKLVSTIDATIHGLTVGLGSGDIASNTAIGVGALSSNTTGVFQTAIGDSALSSNTTGTVNSAFGYLALAGNLTGTHNTAIGQTALINNTTGSYNTGVGTGALQDNHTGRENVAVGMQSLGHMDSGLMNIALGIRAGYELGNGNPNLTPSSSIFIGANTTASTDADSNQIVIGTYAMGNGSNTTTLGNISTTDWYIHGNMHLPTTTGLTTAAVTQTKWLPITINGVSYKLLLAD